MTCRRAAQDQRFPGVPYQVLRLHLLLPKKNAVHDFVRAARPFSCAAHAPRTTPPLPRARLTCFGVHAPQCRHPLPWQHQQSRRRVVLQATELGAADCRRHHGHAERTLPLHRADAAPGIVRPPNHAAAMPVLQCRCFLPASCCPSTRVLTPWLTHNRVDVVAATRACRTSWLRRTTSKLDSTLATYPCRCAQAWPNCAAAAGPAVGTRAGNVPMRQHVRQHVATWAGSNPDVVLNCRCVCALGCPRLDLSPQAAAPSAPTYNSGAEASYDLHGR